ncbi:MAG: sigma-54-dependent Fis family transcriptional regulator [Deltaproteobacteria bacterium]|nr:sigma-54-dependent Fis family transcriptional regulator [Deltaproteobacteria bacterium]
MTSQRSGEQPGFSRADDRTVLVLDDEVSLAKMIARDLRRHGYDVVVAHAVEAARTLLKARPVRFAIVDLMLPDGDGSELVEWALRQGLAEVACVMTGVAQCTNVVRAMQNGSATVFEKPVRPEDLRDFLDAHCSAARDELEQWRQAYAAPIQGADPVLLEQIELAQQIAPSDCTVLVTGETGTGKELFAHAIHAASERGTGPFVALNCAAVPESLIEDELFGHTAGAFTGATQVRGGRIAAADGGTLFLDEIGDMPLPAQSKLLRVLEEGRIIPVGADLPVEVDVRVVAATNRDLDEMARQGTFRADLLYRLNVIQLRLPALRERVGDIVPLAQMFLTKAARHHRRPARHFTDAAQARLQEYHWPGNVRELKNAVERAVLTCPSDYVDARHLRVPPMPLPRVPTPVQAPDPLRGYAPVGPTPRPAYNVGLGYPSAPVGAQPGLLGPMAAPPPAVSAPMYAGPAYPPVREPEYLVASMPPVAAPPVAMPPVAAAAEPEYEAPAAEPESDEELDLKAALRDRERELITMALERTGGNRTEAAALLGLNRTTLVEKLRKVGL